MMASKLLLSLLALTLAVVHVSSQSIGVELETDFYVTKQNKARKDLTTALKEKLGDNSKHPTVTFDAIFTGLSDNLVSPAGFAKTDVLYATQAKTPLTHIGPGHNGHEDRCFRFELDEDTTHRYDVEIVSAPFPFTDNGKQLLTAELAKLQTFSQHLGHEALALAIAHRNDAHKIPNAAKNGAYCFKPQMPTAGWEKTARADESKLCPQFIASPFDKNFYAAPVDKTTKQRYDDSFFLQGQPQVTVSLDVEELVDLFAHSDKLKPYGVPSFDAEYTAFQAYIKSKTDNAKELVKQLDKAGDAWAGFLLILQKYYTIFHEMAGTPPYFKANIAMMFRTKMSKLFAVSNPWRATIPTTTKGNWFWKKVTAHADCAANAGALSGPDKTLAKGWISTFLREVAHVQNSKATYTEHNLLRTSGDNENFDFWVYVDQIVEGVDIMDGQQHQINGVTYVTGPMARLGLESMPNNECAVIFELRKMSGGSQPATWRIPQLVHNLPILFDWWRKANTVGVEKAVKNLPALEDRLRTEDNVPNDPMKN